MAEKKREKAVVLSQKEIAPGIFDLRLAAGEIAVQAVPGQFLSLYCRDGSRLLPRPISICEIDREEKSLRLVYRVAGKGTEEFSHMSQGTEIFILGPLGNGFPLKGKKAFLVGGGIGIPPMLELSKSLNCEKQILLGYRDNLFLNEEFKPYGSVYIATEDGSAGTKGNVIDAIKENGLKADIIYACGPLPMLRALKEYAKEQGIECYVSLEERMACGIGACLGCVCKSGERDAHTNVNNKRICKEGPVFLAQEVEF
ncbi:MAG: dihydroorotate dehydrogenase electron transfer subunit [Lachnospiraceae bacterium]|nr:dihydroorotate dehydrogenase electron transfer subunit [Lachnospiraceae bacterium]MDE6981382.1 dihydroorotate dehydrogenase electron transfer subunit [Lachnospiraceae bacterium]